MDLELKGKKALVTGGTRGIGGAIAERLAREGADVAICSRTPAAVEAMTAALKAHGGKVYGEAVDASDGPALRGFAANAIGALGGVEILVHNVSGWGGLDEAAWRQTFEVDVLGAVRLMEATIEGLKVSGNGSVIFIASTAAVVRSGDRALTMPLRRRSSPMRTACHRNMRRMAFVSIASRLARSFIRTAPGTTSRKTTPPPTRVSGRASPWAAWAHPKRWRTRWRSWPVRRPRSSPAPT